MNCLDKENTMWKNKKRWWLNAKHGTLETEVDKAIPKSHWPSHTFKTAQHVWKAVLSTKLQIITIITPLSIAVAISLHSSVTITNNIRKHRLVGELWD